MNGNSSATLIKDAPRMPGAFDLITATGFGPAPLRDGMTLDFLKAAGGFSGC